MQLNYLIVGAQKAGTTALAQFLAQHPDICMARRKEAHFFDSEDSPVTTEERYTREFPDYRGQRWVGEATPIYMYLPFVAERIYRYNPSMRLLMLLRNPVKRAISHYEMEISRRGEWFPLGIALVCERFRLWRDRNNLKPTSSVRVHSYVTRGFYCRQIERLRRCFPREQLLILKTDDLLNRHGETLDRVYSFLEVEPPPSRPEHRIVRPALGPGIIERRIAPSGLVRAALKRVYRAEIARLERLLGWNLEDWR